METQRRYEDYLAAKTSGEDVMTVAASIAIQVARSEDKPFTVLQLDTEGIIVSHFLVDAEHRCKVTEMLEREAETLLSVIHLPYLRDNQTQRWWDTVFFHNNEGYHYDAFYDTLAVSDNVNAEESETFGTLMAKVRKVLETWDILQGGQQVYLQGDIACSLLAFLIQDIWSCPVTRVQKPVEQDSVKEKENACIPVEQLTALQLHISGQVLNMNYLTKNVLPVCLPIKDISQDATLTTGCTWSQVIHPNSSNEDYRVGNFPIKVLTLEVDYDVYGSTFLIASDLQGNRIVHHLNSQQPISK